MLLKSREPRFQGADDELVLYVFLHFFVETVGVLEQGAWGAVALILSLVHFPCLSSSLMDGWKVAPQFLPIAT